MPRPFLALLAVAMFAAPLSAQTGGGTKAGTSTLAGVYSREQAARGQDVYVGMCKSCHTPESHTAATFTSKWDGKPLSELFSYIRDQMPKNEPGSLSADEYADVLAYVLKLNRMPAGSDDLPAEASDLKGIRLEMRPAKPPTPPRPTEVRKDP